jgi:hypothetical protein
MIKSVDWSTVSELAHASRQLNRDLGEAMGSGANFARTRGIDCETETPFNDTRNIRVRNGSPTITFSAYSSGLSQPFAAGSGRLRCPKKACVDFEGHNMILSRMQAPQGEVRVGRRRRLHL